MTAALDGYTDLERIGQGGLGDVYRATRVSTGGTVAIKMLRDVTDASLAWTRTRRELTALVELGGHAHVVQLVEVLEHTPGLVMEFAPGGSVAQLLEQRGTTLSVAEAVLVGRHTASALAAAHERGIVHRDVKPQNLLVDGYGQVKLCDFGIASLMRTEEFRTRTSAISMRYASPEDLDDEADVGPPADVYSLGATLLHLTHGAPPTLKERLAPWTSPPTDDPALAALDRVLAACLRPTPSARPTAVEVLDRLDELDRTLPDRCRAIEPLVASAAMPEAVPSRTDASPGPPDRTPVPADDETELRTGRRRPEPPRPEPPRRRSALPVAGAVAAIAVLGIVAALAFVLVRDDDTTVDRAAVSETVVAEIVDRPTGLASLDDPAITWPFGPVGECLVQLPDDAELRPVGCDQAHDLERLAVGEIGADAAPADGTYDPDRVDATVDAACDAAAIDAGGFGDEVRVAQTRPSAESWADGDRTYQCLLGVPGRRVVGSLLGG